jgi:hypothetical protein
MAQRMTNETLREKIAKALYERGAAMHYGTPSWTDYPNQQAFLNDADAVFAALGLDDWEAAVDRGGDALADECQDRYDFRMALRQRQILSEIVLRAALTASEDDA